LVGLRVYGAAFKAFGVYGLDLILTMLCLTYGRSRCEALY